MTGTEDWQEFARPPSPCPAVWTARYAAPMPDGRALWLPLRDFGATAVAGLIANQASFVVLNRLAAWMAEAARPLRPDIVVGLPTLGHAVAVPLARALGHANWVAPGTTRKLWYDAALSVPTHSITAPDAGRRIWLDPRLLPRLQGRRVLLVDDVLSTGASARAGIALLEAAGLRPVGVCVAMIQGDRWRAVWDAGLPVTAAFATPRFARTEAGWSPIEGTSCDALCAT
jgi:adenine/guanine phosphoribosyltransferase-like PRPP-binding protein